MGVLVLQASFMRRLQVGHEGDSGMHAERRLGLEGCSLVSIPEKQGGLPKVTQRERCPCGAWKPLPHSPRPTQWSQCFSSVEPLLAVQSTREMCVLKEGVVPPQRPRRTGGSLGFRDSVGEVWLSVRTRAVSSPEVAFFPMMLHGP